MAVDRLLFLDIVAQWPTKLFSLAIMGCRKLIYGRKSLLSQRLLNIIGIRVSTVSGIAFAGQHHGDSIIVDFEVDASKAIF